MVPLCRQSRGDASLSHEVAVGLSGPGRDGLGVEPSAPTGGTRDVHLWDTPYLHMLSSNKDLLEQISASKSDLGILGIWLSWSLSALIVPLWSLVMEQSLPRACRAAARPGGAAAPRGFSLTLFRCETPLCSQVNSILPLAALASHTSQSLWDPSLASRCGKDKRESSF